MSAIECLIFLPSGNGTPVFLCDLVVCFDTYDELDVGDEEGDDECDEFAVVLGGVCGDEGGVEQGDADGDDVGDGGVGDGGDDEDEGRGKEIDAGLVGG